MALIDDVVTIPGLRRAWPADEAISVEIVDERGWAQSPWGKEPSSSTASHAAPSWLARTG